jgi:hypothetical protein
MPTNWPQQLEDDMTDDIRDIASFYNSDPDIKMLYPDFIPLGMYLTVDIDSFPRRHYNLSNK